MTLIDRTILEETGTRRVVHVETEGGGRGVPGSSEECNVGNGERIVSVLAGSILAATGVARRSVPGMIIAGVGGALIYRGVTGYCHAYDLLGFDTADAPKSLDAQQEQIRARGIHIDQAFSINKSPEELYTFWRNLANLPQFMTHLESVRAIDDRRSHWVARAPGIAGGTVEWDAEITRDEPNSLIAWRSLQGSQVDNVGTIRFQPGPVDRGTQVQVSLDYLPPAGKVGHWIASLFGQSAQQQIREELRNFKRLMECGEVVTIAGQTHGTCMGMGNVFRE